jgi:hypothetical protein
MSNEQTDNRPIHLALGEVMPVWNARDAYEILNLDPGMTVSELQRRLRIAERVLTVAANDGGTSWDDPEDLLAWLIREDDQ